MLRVFQNDLLSSDDFLITLELVPGKDSTGRSVDTVMGIARDAFADKRISAVSITDNPGGNPSLSPDVIGYEIFKVGMDVIVHFTCRDLNRVGMESRALQLAMMGMKNLLVLTGDYTGQGFGGRGAPVFDLDSVTLQMMLSQLAERIHHAGDPDAFFTGCAVSPFKATEAECKAQYAKLCRKIAAGAQFIITQLGYDARKFGELIGILKRVGVSVPVLGSVYILTPKAARIMNQGLVPGAVVTDALLSKIVAEWRDPVRGRTLALERAAKLGVVLKGLGYRGMHIGGVHKRFDVVGEILDQMARIESRWTDFLPEFNFPQPNGFYVFPRGNNARTTTHPGNGNRSTKTALGLMETLHFHLLKGVHDRFFSFDSHWAPTYRKLCRWVDHSAPARRLVDMLEGNTKRLLLDCKQCGDCGIQHLAFLCPESQCPKHTRNGACGGSHRGCCEVFPERPCVWVRAYHRLASIDAADALHRGCVPPRMWELDRTASWLNFHLQRDHQSASTGLARFCNAPACRMAHSDPLKN